MQRDWHARKHALQTWYVAAVVRSQSTTLTSDVDPGVVLVLSDCRVAVRLAIEY